MTPVAEAVDWVHMAAISGALQDILAGEEANIQEARGEELKLATYSITREEVVSATVAAVLRA